MLKISNLTLWSIEHNLDDVVKYGNYQVFIQFFLLHPKVSMGTTGSANTCETFWCAQTCLCHDIAEILLKLALNTNQAIKFE